MPTTENDMPSGSLPLALQSLFYKLQLKLDDERVTKEDMKKALDEQYGGEEELPQENPGYNNSPFKFTKFSNAYMLVYTRESDKEKIICNVDEKDVAEHLRVSSPLLILHGAADKVTDPNISKFLYEKAAIKDKYLKLYDGSYRCILEGESDERIFEVLDDIIAWSNSHWTKQSMDMITQGTIVLELRWRSNTVSMFGRSQLLGRAEVSWSGVFESPNMEIERWLMMKSKKKDVKAPSVLIAMKIEVHFGCEVDLVERKRKNKWDERCGCCHGDCSDNTCVDGELFAIEAGLDAF
ncbi:hypothetical protein L2E82_49811 [Cichorium intybus]|uniref:Uncharacterized protein n=1 Tax=Cichorium intybus TaxID=13427 RepID=A0ACB8Z1L8_CICIN|nr:hypothetical protein L2E82_49811 [Cichorium intybus]